MVELLLKEGPDINIKDNVGAVFFTLLFVSFLCIHVDVVCTAPVIVVLCCVVCVSAVV